MTEQQNPRFCSDCGMSLKRLETACTSRNCEECGKEIFYVRRAENGGIKVEEGEKFHIPSLSFSLDPNCSGRFFQFGLESFLKQLFLEHKFDREEIVARFKEQEAAIDSELKQLDCIQHCDMETQEGCDEIAAILEKEGLKTHLYNFLRSCSLRQCYEAIEKGDAAKAAYNCHTANIFKEYSLLEDEHLKEIIWLGYNCYFDLTKNQGATAESIKEIRLIKALGPKIKALESEFVYSLINDGQEIGKRIGVTGVSEETLKSLLEHQLEQRNKDQEVSYREEEIRIKRMSNKIKLWGSLFTLANGLILAGYKYWLN